MTKPRFLCYNVIHNRFVTLVAIMIASRVHPGVPGTNRHPLSAEQRARVRAFIVRHPTFNDPKVMIAGTI
jgi:hypothetical protein